MFGLSDTLSGVLIGGLIGGLAGLGGALIAARSAARIASADRAHQRQMAHDERNQTRLTECYEAIEDISVRVTRSLRTWQPSMPLPGALSRVEVESYGLQLRLYGSGPVATCLSDWTDLARAVLRLIEELMRLDDQDIGARGGDWQQEWEAGLADLPPRRKALSERQGALTKQIRTELGVFTGYADADLAPD